MDNERPRAHGPWASSAPTGPSSSSASSSLFRVTPHKAGRPTLATNDDDVDDDNTGGNDDADSEDNDGDDDDDDSRAGVDDDDDDDEPKITANTRSLSEPQSRQRCQRWLAR